MPIRRGGLAKPPRFSCLRQSILVEHNSFAPLSFCEKKKEKKEYGSPQFCGAGCKEAKPQRVRRVGR